MDIENIITLINAVSEAKITNFQVEEGNFRLTIDKNTRGIQAPVIQTQGDRVDVQASAVPVIPQQNNTVAVQNITVPQEEEKEPVEDEDLKTVTSPIVGTFYSSPGPDSSDFVKIGDRVKKGQTLCIVEAMKLMNDIECEYDGEVKEILVKNEQMVEYGQPLFKIKTD